MKKIPVGATIAYAYRFAFANALAVFKAIWLPLLAQLVLVMLISKRMALFMAATQARDPSALSLFGPLMLLYPLVLIFFFAQFTAATETALGRPAQSWVAFHFGKSMWRLMGGFLSALTVVAAVSLIALLIISLLAAGLDAVASIAPGARPLVSVLALLLAVAFFCVLLLASMRFLFLLAPVNVSEQRLGVRRAWTLSAGNFWRALLITLAIMIPVMIVYYAYIFSLAGLPPLMPEASKEVREAADTAWQIAELNLMAQRWYITLPLTGLLMLFQFGAGCAAQVSAYRALTENEGSVSVPGD